MVSKFWERSVALVVAGHGRFSRADGGPYDYECPYWLEGSLAGRKFRVDGKLGVSYEIEHDEDDSGPSSRVRS